jgi:hypothetical protein
MTPIQKLDEVLKFLADFKPSYSKITDSKIFSPLIKAFPVLHEQGDFGSELLAILSKLEKDKYVTIKDVPTGSVKISGADNTLATYGITFEGMYFIKDLGGYQVQHHSEIEQNIRMEKLETSHSDTASRMNTLTAWVAAGTIGILLLEIIKIFLVK